MNIKRLLSILLLVASALVAGCGGSNSLSNDTPSGGTGGGGGGGGTSRQVTLKVSSQGTSQMMSGLLVALTLPTGTTVATNTDGTVKAGVVVPTGVLNSSTGSVQMISYNTSTRTLQFFMVGVASGGFGSGAFANVVCDYSATAPAADDFVATLQPFDLYDDLTTITGVTATLDLI